MPGEVLLRDVTEADLPTFFDQQRDPAANHMAAFSALNPEDRDAFFAKWTKILANDVGTQKTIVSDGHIAGYIVTFLAPWSGKIEVSYWIGRPFWGQGIATKALSNLLDSLTTRPLHARAAQDNGGSIRVLQNCGFQITGSDRGFANARGAEIDEVVLELRRKTEVGEAGIR